jgi:protease-4
MLLRIVVMPALLAIVLLSAGCGGVRFVIDAVPAVDDITETTVLSDPGAKRSSKVAMIDVNGVLADARVTERLSSGENPVNRFTESLRRAEKDRRVKAVVVRINSPGGTVTASDLMYRELQHFRANTGKPVVVLMAGVAASGGFYVACAGDEIIAHPTTVTGSIGVIMQTFNVSEGMQRFGIRSDAITSGPNKSMGSPFAPMPPEHRALLQNMVNEFYDRFLGIVRERRPDLGDEALARVTDGRIVTGLGAAEAGLVDGTGDIRDAFAAAKERAGLTAARLVKYHRPLEHVGSVYAHAPGADSTGALRMSVDFSTPEPGFYYLWDPTAW